MYQLLKIIIVFILLFPIIYLLYLIMLYDSITIQDTNLVMYPMTLTFPSDISSSINIFSVRAKSFCTIEKAKRTTRSHCFSI